MKQVKIKDNSNDEIHAGILLDNGDVICLCCGGLIPAEKIGTGKEKTDEILKIYDTWIDVSEWVLD